MCHARYRFIREEFFQIYTSLNFDNIYKLISTYVSLFANVIFIIELLDLILQ